MHTSIIDLASTEEDFLEEFKIKLLVFLNQFMNILFHINKLKAE
jgi:hypothetical protein